MSDTEATPDVITLEDGTVITSEYLGLVKAGDAHYKPEQLVGKDAVFVRTVTMYYLGKPVAYNPATKELTLKNAVWIASTGKWTEFLVKGPEAISECEPYPRSLPTTIRMDTAVEYCEWEHDIPTEPKSS